MVRRLDIIFVQQTDSSSPPDHLMYITAAGQGLLVLNSHRAANDLLVRRGHIYSDRPRMISECQCTHKCLPQSNNRSAS